MLEVVDHVPASWFLLADGDVLYLDVNCNHHAFGYSVLIELDDRERARLDSGGSDYLAELAQSVHHSAPIVNDRSPYRLRDLTESLGGDVTNAVRRWRERRTPSASGR